MVPDAGKMLRGSSLAFGAAWALHVADHVRRGLDASPRAVFVVGALQGALVAGAVWMAWSGHRRAAAAAVGVGVLSAFLVTYGHLVPGTGAGSADAFASAPGVTWFSWLTAYGELGGALVFALAGVRAWSAGDETAS